MSRHIERPTLSDALRRAIAESGRPPKVIAECTGVDRASLCRFLKPEGSEGRRSLSLTNADSIARFLGLELRPARLSPLAEALSPSPTTSNSPLNAFVAQWNRLWPHFPQREQSDHTSYMIIVQFLNTTFVAQQVRDGSGRRLEAGVLHCSEQEFDMVCERWPHYREVIGSKPHRPWGKGGFGYMYQTIWLIASEPVSSGDTSYAENVARRLGDLLKQLADDFLQPRLDADGNWDVANYPETSCPLCWCGIGYDVRRAYWTLGWPKKVSREQAREQSGASLPALRRWEDYALQYRKRCLQ